MYAISHAEDLYIESGTPQIQHGDMYFRNSSKEYLKINQYEDTYFRIHVSGGPSQLLSTSECRMKLDQFLTF